MESASPVSRYIPQKSKKRVFPGGSSTCTDADVVEIPPPVNWGLKPKPLLEQKEITYPEIIYVDLDEDCANVATMDDKVLSCGKGKDPSDSGDGIKEILVTDAHSKISPAGPDDHGSDLFSGDDKYYEDIMYDDEYAILQSHFDNLDIPTGIEAPIPWLSAPDANNMKSSTTITSDNFNPQSMLDVVGCPTGVSSSHPSWYGSAQFSKKKAIPGSSSSSATASAALGQTPSTWSFAKFHKGKNKETTPKSFAYSEPYVFENPASWEKPPKSFRSHTSSRLKKKLSVAGGALYSTPPKVISIGAPYAPTNTKHHGFNNNLWTGAPPSITGWQNLNVTGNSSGNTWISTGYPGSYSAPHFLPNETAHNPWFIDPAFSGTSSVSSDSSIKVEYGNPDETVQKFLLFKKFDTVQDFFDHHYFRKGSTVRQPTKSWSKRIQDEWRILEKDLPDSIFVRVYESRMDLLRAVIVGAEGTPYHDGLYFFDVFFPSSYPNSPPQVYYHSGGLRINPNLYHDGKVCLSLLGTWSGSQKERWIPGVSTMLQVLVSIQGLILNAKPYFNEPGFASMSGSISGEQSSLQYNERTFILTLRTMVYSIKRPPKYFEDFVAGHFHNHAREILVACQAYIDGAQVGCLVKGGVQDVDEGDKSCSREFRYHLAKFIKVLVDAFKLVGAEECDQFLPLVHKADSLGPVPSVPYDYYN